MGILSLSSHAWIPTDLARELVSSRVLVVVNVEGNRNAVNLAIHSERFVPWATLLSFNSCRTSAELVPTYGLIRSPFVTVRWCNMLAVENQEK